MKADLTLNCLKSYLRGRSTFTAKYFEDNISFFKQQVFVELSKTGEMKKACRFSTSDETHQLFSQWREEHCEIYWAWSLDKHSLCALAESGYYLVSYGDYDGVVYHSLDSRELQIQLEELCQEWAIPSQKIQSFSFVKLRGLSF